MTPLQLTLKHLLGALVIVTLFRLLIAPAFDVQSLASLYARQSTTGGPVQRAGGDLDLPDLPFGLLQLADGIDPVVDIVAIHGLDGHREESWKAKNGVLWLRDLLPQKIPEARILSYGYDANTRGHEQLSVETLDGHAVALVSKLALTREETSTKERPIIFVAHSLGGIILKNALIHAYSTHRNHLPGHKAIDLSTYGILFLGTPHQGSESANLAKLFSNILSIVTQTNDALVKHIQKDSEALQLQLPRYSSISAQFDTKFFYESYETPLVSGIKQLIVPKSSAVVPGAINVEPIPINKDHVNMVKFASADDEDFKTISSHLYLMVQAAPKKIVTNWGRYYHAHEGYDHKTTAQKMPCLPPKLRYERDNGTFFGRERELEWIHKSFVDRHIIAIYGLGGIGKTRLAVEYIYAYERDYNAIFWATADTKDSITLSFVAMAQQLLDCEPRILAESTLNLGTFTSMARRRNLTDHHGSILTNETDRVVSAVISWLSDSAENWLLVLDNADDLDSVDLRSFLPTAASRRILITSRDPKSRHLGIGLETQALPEDAAVQLLLQNAGKEGEDEKARQIVENLEYFPLAIEQAGAYISMLQLDLTSYVEEYQRDRTRWKQVLERKLPGVFSSYGESVFTTWEVSRRAAEQRNPYAGGLLDLCGFFAAEDIPVDLFQTGLDSDARLDDALEQLFSFSLAKRVAGGRSFSMHSLVHAWARERLDRKDQVTVATDAVRLLGAKFASFGLDDETRRAFSRKVVSHVAACVENAMHLDVLRHLKIRWTGWPYLSSWATNAVNYGILQIFRYPDHDFVQLLDEIARICFDYDLQCAKVLQRATLEWSINILGPYDVWTLRRMTSLSMTLGRNEPGDAMALILHTLDRHEKIQGITHRRTFRNVSIRSGIDLTLGKFGQAVGAFQRFLYGKKIHGPNHKKTLDTAYYLSVEFIMHQSKFVEGEELLRRALVGQEYVAGQDLPFVPDIFIRDALALTTMAQGRFEEAEDLYFRLLKHQEKLLGPNHNGTLATLGNLIIVYYHQRKFEEAEHLCRRLLERQEKLLGPDYIDTLATLNQLALVNLEQEKFEEAEHLFLRLLECREKLLGPDHNDTLTVLNKLASANFKQGKFEEVEHLYRRLLERRENLLGPDNNDTLAALDNLGYANFEQGKFEEAEHLYLRLLGRREKLLGPDHIDTLAALDSLASTHFRQGKFEEAEHLFLRLLECREKLLGPYHNDTLAALNKLGYANLNQEKFEEAEHLYLRLLEREEKLLGPDHNYTLGALGNLAFANFKQGKFEEAEHLYLRLLECQEKLLGPDHNDTLAALNKLTSANFKQGKFEEAEHLYRRLLEHQEKLLGPYHNDTLAALDQLGSANFHQGKFEEAEHLCLRLLQRREKLLGPYHNDTLGALGNLAFVNFKQGKFEEAEQLYRQLLQRREKLLGPDHIDTLAALDNFASAHFNQGKFEEAEHLFLRLLQRREKLLGPSHSGTIMALRNLGFANFQQWKFEEAEHLFLRLLERREKLLGPDHIDTLAALDNLALVTIKQEKFGEAEHLYRRLLERQEKLLRPDHIDTLAALNNLAAANFKQGKFEEVEHLLLQLLERREKLLGPDHIDTLAALNNLALVAIEQEKFGKAEHLYRRLLERQEKLLEPDHVDMLAALNNLAFAHFNQEKFEEAEHLYHRLLERREKLLGPDHSDTLKTLDNLASAHFNQEKFEEAEHLYLQLLKRREKLLGPDHIDTLTALDDLASANVDQGKFEEAERLYRRLLEHREKLLGPDHNDTLATLDDLAAAKFKQNWTSPE